MHRTPKTLVALWALAILMTIPMASFAADEEGETLLYETREQIPERYRWNLDDIFASTDAWNEAAASVEKRIPDLTAFAGKLAESPELLADALDLRYEIEGMVDDLYVYASQWQRTNTRNDEANELFGRAQGIYAGFVESTAFIIPEIAQIDAQELETFRKHERLATYGHLLDDILRSKAHVLSTREEEILAGSSLLKSAPGDLYSSLVFSDMSWPSIEGEDGEQVKVIPAQFYTLMGSQDRRVRREGALALFGTYQAYGNTLARTLSASIQKDIWTARTRNYESTLEAALDGINVPRTVLDNLLTTVHDNLDAVHRYVALRKKVLEIDDFHIYDLYVSMVPSVDRTVTFDEGWKLAMEFWKETFGDDYAAVTEKALAERWVDVYSNEGKRGGAFSWGTYNSHPYLFLNWGGTLEDVFTLVHEMGHSVHSYLAFENQEYHNAGYSLFVAEVGSVASESLFFEWLLARTEDPTERLALLNFRMNAITGTFLRQIFFHEFEAAVHAMAEGGEPLTQESLGETWGRLWKSYYGDEATLDEQYRAGWARIPHFYRTFYVWNYASSFAAGEAIAGRFRSGDESAVTDYLETLKLGGSVYAMDALQKAGVDMNRPEVSRAVMDRYSAILTEMEALLAE